ncbi:hypothetical protein V6N12_039956 [Hibiscus sabdariffa]|uniref:BRX domain-containing protein n=1 Tax=Hibiscus sabdariffa TaxID=183260 RepID=A0ABR2E2B4_9ROSI
MIRSWNYTMFNTLIVKRLHFQLPPDLKIKNGLFVIRFPGSSPIAIVSIPLLSCTCFDTKTLHSINGVKTETSSIDGSVRTSSSREADRSGELSVSNTRDMETEWVEQDESGVYITIRALPGGTRELRRVRFRGRWERDEETIES